MYVLLLAVIDQLSAVCVAIGNIDAPEAHQIAKDFAALKAKTEAFYAKKRRVAMKDSTGLVAGEFVMSYPPGIPIVAPGERITPDVLAHILYAKEKGCFMTGTEDMDLNYINVLM